MSKSSQHTPELKDDLKLEIGLNAAIIMIDQNQPHSLIIPSQQNLDTPPTPYESRICSLPFGPFSPYEHRTLEIGLRSWVLAQTDLELGYVEQLYSFADRGRHAQLHDVDSHFVSIGYLALTHNQNAKASKEATWQSWYTYFPWEDWRSGKPSILNEEIEPRLTEWAHAPSNTDQSVSPLKRRERLRICFGMEGGNWDEEKALERYELLYEAGLVQEAIRDKRNAAQYWQNIPAFGEVMIYDHRRILATAMGRLRGKIKYRPVIFELMPDVFTLFDLQKTVEAISGRHIHKQNFRRLVEGAGLVEPTSQVSQNTGGRPAKLFRFRREVLLERPAPGVRVSSSKN
ncbi:MAG: NAD regulator [Pseudomonadota bacterium]